MLRMFIKGIILVNWTLSSSANEQSLLHHDEGITTASRSLNNSPRCPCFSNDEIEDAAQELKQGTMTANLEKTSCQRTSEGSYGLYYMNDVPVNNERIFNSFSVGGRDGNQARTCMKDGTAETITTEEENVCLALLQNSCDYLNVMRVSLDGTCPCYKENHLSDAVTSINSGYKILEKSSCTLTPGTSNSFFYKSDSDDAMVEGYSIYTSQFSRKCRFGGDIAIRHLSAQSADDCFRIIEEACEDV